MTSQAERLGDREAVSFSGEAPLTYGDIERQSNALARGFLARGIRRGDRIATILPNGTPQLLTWIAAMKIGAIAVPLNTSLAARDLSHALGESDPIALIAGDEYVQTVASIPAVTAAGGTRLHVRIRDTGPAWGDLGFDELFDADTSALPVVAEPSDTACILFTGGTTGLPKATMRTHFSYLCAIERYKTVYDPRPGDRHLSSTQLFHCGGQEMGLLGPFASGIPTMLPKWFSASRFWDIADGFGATIGEIMPTMMSILLKAEPSPRDREHTLRLAIGRGPAEEFERRFGTKIVSTYGSTETGTMLFTNTPADSRAGSSGRPRGWAEVRIAGEHDEPLPSGEIGELLLRPALPYSMSLGYYNRPAETLQRWRNFWIHTGDLAYLDEDGWLHVVGRQAHWIRRRGENVSVAEVEEVIEQHPSVIEAAVVGIPAELGEQDIRAYVSSRAASPDPDALAEWCKERLAYFKTPVEFVFVDELPRSVTKREIERHKLVEWPIDRSTGVLRACPPRPEGTTR
ncbi:AMP-binding protein [Dactylosporangium sp. NPDC051485]|uniref:AMP-binding protein n=1 Tax=Dactylosporangium sp. NPDC051485 TaxID=3154846 RepID=UPI003431CA1D